MFVTSLEERLRSEVQRAAIDFDQNYPGWFEKIDLSTLQIHDKSNCICGQVGLNWETEGSRLFGNSISARPFTFRSAKKHWITEIEARLARSEEWPTTEPDDEPEEDEPGTIEPLDPDEDYELVGSY